MGRGGGRSGGGGSSSSHSSSRGVTSGRSGGGGFSSTRSGGFTRGSSSSSRTHRGGAGFGGPGVSRGSGSGTGSGRVTGGSRSGGYGGGYGHPTPPPPAPRFGGWRRRRYYGGPVYGGPVYTGGGYVGTGGAGGCAGCLGVLVLLTIILALAIFLIPASYMVSGMRPSTGTSATSQISQVSHTHKKLAASECDEADVWLDDQAGWIDNQSKVIKALRYFYNKTGSQPYLVVATDINGKEDFTDAEGEAWANAIYDKQFNDDGHTVVAFVEYAESEYAYYIVAGRAAQSVIDDEAREIIADEINYWYTDPSLDDSAYFAKVFTESADTIMFDYEQTTKTANSRKRMVMLAVCVVGAAAAVGFVVMRSSKRKREEYEAARKLAETPISGTGGIPGGVQSATSGTSSDSASSGTSTLSELEQFEQKYGKD